MKDIVKFTPTQEKQLKESAKDMFNILLSIPPTNLRTLAKLFSKASEVLDDTTGIDDTIPKELNAIADRSEKILIKILRN